MKQLRQEKERGISDLSGIVDMTQILVSSLAKYAGEKHIFEEGAGWFDRINRMMSNLTARKTALARLSSDQKEGFLERMRNGEKLHEINWGQAIES